MIYKMGKRTITCNIPTIQVYLAADRQVSTVSYGVYIGEIDGDTTLSDKLPATTDNRTALLALIAALKAVKSNKRSNVFIHHESEYIQNSTTKYINRWGNNGFLNANGDKIKNADLWKEFIKLDKKHNFIYRYFGPSKQEQKKLNSTNKKYFQLAHGFSYYAMQAA